MKIALVGNIANNFYREAKALQNSSSISAELYFYFNPDDNTRLPESDEPILKNNYPDWIKTYDGVRVSFRTLLLFAVGIKKPLLKRNEAIVRRLDKYELCVLSGEDVCLAPFLKNKKMFRATGADLTVYPIFSYKQINELYPSPQAKTWFSSLRDKLYWKLYQHLWKQSIQSCDFADAGHGAPFRKALRKIKYPENKIVNIFRLAIDTSIFKERLNAIELRKKWGLADYKFIIFLPSRIMLRATQILVDTGQWKASDNAIYGFLNFLNRIQVDERKNIVLVIPERTINSDLQQAKQIIDDHKMNNNVIFISGEKAEGLSRNEMIDLYSLSDVVMDDFGAGWYGSIVVEAMSCGIPVVTYAPKDLMESLFPWNPIRNAKTPEEIGEALFLLYSDDKLRVRTKEESRQWVTEFHSNDAVRTNLELELRRLAKNNEQL